MISSVRGALAFVLMRIGHVWLCTLLGFAYSCLFVFLKENAAERPMSSNVCRSFCERLGGKDRALVYDCPVLHIIWV